MIYQSKFTRVAVKTLAAAFTIFGLTQCTNQEEIIAPTAAAEKTETTATAASEEPVLSLTIDGVNTVLSSTTDCKACDYFVPEDATVVDGKELGIKPGQAICFKANTLYGNLRLINLEGEVNNPIVIAYGVKTIDTSDNQ
jgi:hypothetical protein